MRILFIGGTGVISSACTEAAIEKGIEVVLFNRGKSIRPAPPRAQVVHVNARDPRQLQNVVENQFFDVVVDWIAYTPADIELDLLAFRGRCRQFIFISSASVYQTPPAVLPVTEDTPLENPYWQYSRDKIACERRLEQARRKEGFPVTIVRPSHTYDKTMLPCRGGWTTIDRMRRGLPVIIHGDGTSIWTLTHHRDFAKGFVGLLGREDAVGEAFHITSEEWLTWNQIYEILADAAGASLEAVHVPSEWIAALDPNIGAGLLGDKMHSMIFDNRKIRRFVPEFRCEIPFREGAKEIIAWYDQHPEFQKIDENYQQLSERLVSIVRRVMVELGEQAK
ncbi:MAG: SDR family oxidoreductase [candidate division KSB1 bacterium]|nr:SDR family oxidoreductase [candidate division KSB1 bacterium]MDZ7345287.1 SDR family oxidoreductase [candidate division KSB1 bacterium]